MEERVGSFDRLLRTLTGILKLQDGKNDGLNNKIIKTMGRTLCK